MSEFILIFILLFIGSLYYVKRNSKWKNYLEDQYIPIAPTNAWGLHKIDFKKQDLEKMNTFGHIWGEYETGKPNIFIADKELIFQVLNKKFSYFTDRQDFFNIPDKVIGKQ